MTTYRSVPTAGWFIAACAILMMTGLLTLTPGCQKDDGVDPADPPLDEKTAAIGTDGGRIQLQSGIEMVIPPGALSEAMEISLSQYKAADYFPGDADDHIVIGCKPGGLTLLKPVTLNFPVPASFDTSYESLAGFINPASGLFDVYPSNKTSAGDTNFVTMETDHFSEFWTWYFKSPPFQAHLEVPFYNQGSSEYCWAADMKMICEAVRHDDRKMHDIIGSAGYDATGLLDIFQRTDPRISTIIQSHSGIAPQRFTWVKTAAISDLATYLRKMVAAGHPVAVQTPVENHAFVVVGYDGTDFFIHNPASLGISGDLGYTKKAWTDFKTDQMGNTIFVTMAIQAKVSPSVRLQNLNIGPKEMYFRMPGPGTVINQITYEYDHRKPKGYSFVNYSGIAMDTLPGNVEELVLKDVQLANASKTQNKTISLRTRIISLEDAKKVYYSDQKTIQVNANSMGKYSENIPLSELTKDLVKVEEFELKIEAYDGTGNIDEFKVYFSLAPPLTISIGFRIQAKDKDSGTLYTEYYATGPFPGVFSGNTFTFSYQFSQDGSDFKVDGYATLNASRTNVIELQYTYFVRTEQEDPLYGSWTESSYTYQFEDIPLTLLNNRLKAELSGIAVCEKLNENEVDSWFDSESLGLIDLDVNYVYQCNEESFLFIDLPKP